MRRVVGISFAALTMFGSLCNGQCPRAWAPGEAIQGLSDPAQALVAWDPDGAGPRQEVLVAGGRFRAAGSVAVRGLAVWDGVEWSALGWASQDVAGFDDWILDLAVFRGELIACGYFAHVDGADASGLARWTGTEWRALAPEYTGKFVSLHVHNDRLYAGGSFLRGSDNAPVNVACWDGAAWTPLGAGASAIQGTVYDLTTFNGQVVAGGTFAKAGGVTVNNIARWSGSAWSALGAGADGAVEAVCSYQGALVASGSFKNIGGQPWKYAARWNGSAWSAMDSASLDTRQWELYEHQGVLYAASYSDKLHALGRWDGAHWQAVDANTLGQLYTMTSFRGQLVVSGSFAREGSTWWWLAHDVNNIGLWDGSDWEPLGSGWNGQVNAMTLWNGDLVVGGLLKSAGSVPVEAIAVRRDGEWQPLGNGFSGTVSHVLVHAGDLLAAGELLDSGSTPVGRVARWTGDRWEGLGVGQPLAPGGKVVSMLAHDDDVLVLSTPWSGSSSSQVLKWDGQSWSLFAPALSGLATAMCVHDGELLVGGTWLGDGDWFAVRWTGSAWEPVGENVSLGAPGEFREFGGELYAVATDGYSFELPGAPLATLIKFNGTEWVPVAPSGSEDGPFPAGRMMEFKGRLYAGGTNTPNGTASWSNLMRLDEDRWTPVARIEAYVRALLVEGDELLIGGYLGVAGETVSGGLARWTCTCPADVTGDTFVNGEDFDRFVNWFVSGDTRADFDGNALVNGADFESFVEMFTAGC